MLVAALAATAAMLVQPGARAALAAQPDAVASVPATGPVVWLAANSSVANLAQVNRSVAVADMGAGGTMIQATAMVTQNPVPAGYRSLPTERWTSYARFAGAAAAGRIPSYIRVAHYDNEAWGQTPVAEQHHPGLYERKFCQVAHAHGLLCVTSPGRDICAIAFPNSGSNNHCYLSHDMAGSAAKYADYIDIQGEVNELRGTSAYKAFITRAATQARRANPHIIALGNLNATVSGQSVTAAQMNADARAVYGTHPWQVSGFYMTIDNAGARTTARFMQLFEP